MIQYLVLLGSNLGDRPLNLQQAVGAISKLQVTDLITSKIYKSPAWGFESTESFLNQAVKFSSILLPEILLDQLLGIETKMGRQRVLGKGYASRTIDIDILLAGELMISTKELTVPHPRMQERKFALIPSAEVAGSWQHPTFEQSVAHLLSICLDQSVVEVYE